MNTPLQTGSLKIITIMGIPIRVHFSWLIIFGLITWSLSTFYFPKAAPQLPTASYWINGAVAALLLFVSVAFHELSHSFVAIKYKLSIINITLFIFGGVAQMKGEPPSPKAEFRIAIAGPLSSFFLSLIFAIAYNTAATQVTKALFSYLAQLNLILGAFNLIPGFPMDGGRVVRAFLWKKTNDFFYATQKASSYGQKIAMFFIIFGIFSIFVGFPGGLWLMLIGWFLYSASQASYQQASLQQTLNGIKVRNIMVKDIVTMPSNITVDRAVNEYFLKYGYGGFPVVDNGRFLGFITLKEIKDVPRENWGDVKISEIFVPHNKKWEISEDDDVIKALELMIMEDKGRLVVTDKEGVTGLITRNGIARYVQIMGR
ncbi:peptidase M50 [Dissulfurispira thermophila]|uniref:Zinc metalloprotease n=1 Tax=Dissulfurispira thermophila TaxID=2715679 RepID=A0A7G1GZI6_9BACT|nr:site-2 protease family protein [Dissulfurispira thermophila]BCB95794.1 peptidase M50 [Dissulfurispira thermophila]